MVGYLPEADTAAAFDDGWYRTGDIGVLDEDGWLHITDRLKEMIKVRGFQVAPAEVEAVLPRPPGGAGLRGGSGCPTPTTARPSSRRSAPPVSPRRS
jgi:acyl-CoA synthetase (AMP-forming)/AMP-acid ligase II